MEKIHNGLSQRMRQSRDEFRESIELLRSRVEMLAGKDKLLMKMYLDNGNSIRQLARLAGVNDASISRRINRIVKRLTDGEYIICLQNCDKFTKAEMTIAKEYFLLGFSVKKIATKRNWSYHHARKIIIKIRQRIKDSAQDD